MLASRKVSTRLFANFAVVLTDRRTLQSTIDANKPQETQRIRFTKLVNGCCMLRCEHCGPGFTRLK